MIFIVLICPLGIGISDDSDEKIGVIEDSLVATSSLTTVETVKRCSEWRLNYIYGLWLAHCVKIPYKKNFVSVSLIAMSKTAEKNGGKISGTTHVI